MMAKFLNNIKDATYEPLKRQANVAVLRVQTFIENNSTASQDAITEELKAAHNEVLQVLSNIQPRGTTLGFREGKGFGFWESHTQADVDNIQVNPDNTTEKIPSIYKMRGLLGDLDRMIGQGFCPLGQYEVCKKVLECHRSIKPTERKNEFNNCVVLTVEVTQES